MGVENRWIGRLLEDSGSGAQWHIDLWLKAQGKVEHSLLSFAAMADRAVLAKPDRPTGGCDFDVVVTAAGHWFAVLWTPRRTETPLGEKLELAVMDMLPEEMFDMTALQEIASLGRRHWRWVDPQQEGFDWRMCRQETGSGDYWIIGRCLYFCSLLRNPVYEWDDGDLTSYMFFADPNCFQICGTFVEADGDEPEHFYYALNVGKIYTYCHMRKMWLRSGSTGHFSLAYLPVLPLHGMDAIRAHKYRKTSLIRTTDRWRAEWGSHNWKKADVFRHDADLSSWVYFRKVRWLSDPPCVQLVNRGDYVWEWRDEDIQKCVQDCNIVDNACVDRAKVDRTLEVSTTLEERQDFAQALCKVRQRDVQRIQTYTAEIKRIQTYTADDGDTSVRLKLPDGRTLLRVGVGTGTSRDGAVTHTLLTALRDVLVLKCSAFFPDPTCWHDPDVECTIESPCPERHEQLSRIRVLDEMQMHMSRPSHYMYATLATYQSANEVVVGVARRL